MTEDEFIDDVIQRIPVDAEFDDVAIEEARKILRAALFGRDNDAASFDIKVNLTGLTNGFGCWLGDVEGALVAALDASTVDEQYRGEILGSFRMAKHWLFDIEGHNARHEKL